MQRNVRSYSDQHRLGFTGGKYTVKSLAGRFPTLRSHSVYARSTGSVRSLAAAHCASQQVCPHAYEFEFRECQIDRNAIENSCGEAPFALYPEKLRRSAKNGHSAIGVDLPTRSSTRSFLFHCRGVSGVAQDAQPIGRASRD